MIEKVELQEVLPPEVVKPAFNEVNEAVQQKEKMIYQSQESYNKAIPKARGQAQQTIEEAEGYAIQKVNQAKGDIARFLAVYSEYRKNPRITRTRLYYEMFEEILKTGDTEFIDKMLKNFVPFKSLNKGGEK